MGVTVYVAVLAVFIALALWCWATRKFTLTRLGALVALTVAQAVLAVRIDYVLGVAFAAVFLGIEMFALFEELES